MRLALVLVSLVGLARTGWSQDPAGSNESAWKLEIAGQVSQAQMRLERAAAATPPNAAAIRAYAEFQDRYRDPGAWQYADFLLGSSAGAKHSATVLLSPGKYTIYCTVPGHEASGMKATITVAAK